jgi:hypothetical protein
MAPRAQRHWAPWIWAAAALAVAAHVVVIFLWRGEPAVPPPAAASRPRVTVVAESATGGGPLVKEQIELFDQQPLSMPTPWNAGATPLPAALRRQPGEVFGLYEPRLAFAAERLEPVFTPRGGAPQDSLAGLRVLGTTANGWGGLGRLDRPAPALPARDAGVEVRSFASGEVVLQAALSELPALVREHDWAPLEYSVVVARVGLVGVPTLASGSGVEEIDAFFGSYLVRQFRLAERLPPGFYRVDIGR